MDSMEIQLRMLTPLWTGGVDGTTNRIHETGLIGSLRWWYEAIVRGLGGKACDPTAHTCELSGQRLQRYKTARKAGKDLWTALDEAGICDACKVFGTTGWRRRFRLDIVDETQSAWTPPPDTLNIRPPDRARGWFLPPGRVGSFTLRLHGDAEVLARLASLFLFLERWGSIGAKPQLGYGVFEITNRREVVKRAGEAWVVMGSQSPNREFPDLRRFGFFRYRFVPQKPGWWTRVPGMERIASKVQPLVSKHKMVPLAPALKNEWRFRRWTGSPGDEKWMFGTLKWRRGKETLRVRSKIAVSWAYLCDSGWEVRGWVWLQRTQIATQVWNLLQDEEGWQEVLGVRGELIAHPEGRWQERTAEDVARFLEETK